MSLESISSQGIKQKLRSLRFYISKEKPKENDIISEFGSLLADRLGKEVNPLEFYYRAKILLYELETLRTETFSGVPIKNKKLIDLDPIIYQMLNKLIPDIARHTCPENFSMRVREFYQDN